MKSCYFGGLGGSWDQVWNQGGKKVRFRAISSPLREIILSVFPYFLQVFFRAFPETLFVALDDFGAQRCNNKKSCWEVILMLFWWWGGYVKIDVLCRRQLS